VSDERDGDQTRRLRYCDISLPTHFAPASLCWRRRPSPSPHASTGRHRVPGPTPMGRNRSLAYRSSSSRRQPSTWPCVSSRRVLPSWLLPPIPPSASVRANSWPPMNPVGRGRRI